MPLRQPYGARRYNEPIELTYSEAVVDDYGHAEMGKPVVVGEAYAYVRQMSAAKTMATFQQMDAIGLEIEMRTPSVRFNGLRYRGNDVYFAHPEDVGGRGRVIRMSGYYQMDHPKAL